MPEFHHVHFILIIWQQRRACLFFISGIPRHIRSVVFGHGRITAYNPFLVIPRVVLGGLLILPVLFLRPDLFILAASFLQSFLFIRASFFILGCFLHHRIIWWPKHLAGPGDSGGPVARRGQGA